MALSKPALKKVKEGKSTREAFKAFLEALVQNQTITQDVAGLIGHALDAHPELDDASKVTE